MRKKKNYYANSNQIVQFYSDIAMNYHKKYNLQRLLIFNI